MEVVKFGNTSANKDKLKGLNKTDFKAMFKGQKIGININKAWGIVEPHTKVKAPKSPTKKEVVSKKEIEKK